MRQRAMIGTATTLLWLASSVSAQTMPGGPSAPVPVAGVLRVLRPDAVSRGVRQRSPLAVGPASRARLLGPGLSGATLGAGFSRAACPAAASRRVGAG